MRRTPYAADDEEAKDYELDAIEREKEITDGEDIEHIKRMLEHAKKVAKEGQMSEQPPKWTPSKFQQELDRLHAFYQKQLAAERQATSNAFSKGYDQGHADAIGRTP